MLPFTILLLLILLSNIICISNAQQSAAGQDTLIGIVGRDFIMMGADSSSSGGGGIALTSCSVDKLAVIHDGMGLSDVRSSHDDDNTSIINKRESMKQQAVAIGFAGDVADADRLLGTLRTHAQVKEYEAGIGNDVQCVFDGQAEESTTLGSVSPSGLDAEAIANLSRNQIASRMRSRAPLQLCLLVGGMVRCNNGGSSNKSQVQVVDNRVQKQISTASASYSKSKSSLIDTTSYDTVEEEQEKSKDGDSHQTSLNPYLTPKLFWLDQYGSIQNMKYASHGYASNFAYSILDQRYRTGMTREESIELIRECFEQLRQRYVINSPQPPRIKCIDRYGVTEIIDESKIKK